MPPSVDEKPALLAALDAGMRALRWIALVVLAVVVGMGCLLRVDQHEGAFVLRWGRIVGQGPARVRRPGLYLVWPYPLEEVVRVPVERVRALTSHHFWHAAPENGGDYGANTLTADANILYSAWTLRYVVDDPERHVFHFQDAERLLLYELERAVLRACTLFGVDEILRATGEFSDTVTRILRERCRMLVPGVRIERVELVRLSPPPRLRESFDDVLRAEQERGAMLEQARSGAHRRLAEARADAVSITARAESARRRAVNDLAASADYFVQLLPAYRRRPALVAQMLLYAGLQTVMSSVDRHYLVEKSAGRELRLLIDGDARALPSLSIE